jgi:hypothetical protein
MIYGLTKDFAVETEKVMENFGFIRFWLNDFCIGLWETTYLKPVIISLNRLVDYSAYEQLNIKMNTPKKVLDHILKNDELFEYTLLGLGETFEPFEIRAYLYNSEVVFIWRLGKKITYDAALYVYEPNIVYSGIINQENYYSILTRLEESIN